MSNESNVVYAQEQQLPHIHLQRSHHQAAAEAKEIVLLILQPALNKLIDRL
jgi:hypothetical protein